MIRPPRIALWLHEQSLAADDREAVIGDLVEEFAARAAHDPWAARLWVWTQTCRSRRPKPAPASRASSIDGGARLPRRSPYVERSKHRSPVRPSAAQTPTADVVCRVALADGGIGTEHPARDPRRCRVGASTSVARSRPPRRAPAAARVGLDAQLLIPRLPRSRRSGADARRAGRLRWSQRDDGRDREARSQPKARSSRAISSRRSAYRSALAAS